ncbi:MAG TPA: host attachment protein [Xanthobacteraceae bacterium]|nr:host attachment protein [Xanthobacteraceae bacterium]
MDKLRVGTGEWVVVCDGAKALVFENAGDAKFPNLKTREVYEQENPKTSEAGTDAPGRSVNSTGSARSTMEQTDWHDEAEKAFLGQLASRLNAAVEAGESKAIVVVAAPRALGVLRQSFSAGVKDVIKAEIGKDYVKMPVHQIEKLLLGAP